MNPRRLVAPLAVTAAVAAGGIAGALIGVPAMSDAQETTTTEAPADEVPGRLGRPGGPGHIEAVAEALGIEVDALHEALRGGQTIAEVATAQGVDVNTVIDAMVADVIENNPDRDEAEVRERITTLVNEGRPAGGPGGPGGGPGGRGHGRGPGPGFDAAAEALGMEPTELGDAMREGQTIAEIASEQGVDVDTVIDAMVADARERIETFVNEGPQKPPAPEADESTADAEDTAS